MDGSLPNARLKVHVVHPLTKKRVDRTVHGAAAAAKAGWAGMLRGEQVSRSEEEEDRAR